MQIRITSKTVVAFILYTVLVVSITCAVTTKMLSKDNVEETSSVNTDSIEASSEPTEDVEIVEEDVDVVTADLVLSDGTKLLLPTLSYFLTMLYLSRSSFTALIVKVLS